MNNILINETKNLAGKIDKVLDQFDNQYDVKIAFDFLFENISNKAQSKLNYDLNKILKTDPINGAQRVYENSLTNVLVDIIPYKKAPHGYVVILNGFKDQDVLMPTIMELYILKETQAEAKSEWFCWCFWNKIIFKRALCWK